MAEFDKKDWMEDQGLKFGEWQVRGKMPVGIHCDVRLKNGQETGPCWPNKGVFIDLSDDDKEIKPTDVLFIRPYLDVDPEKDDGRQEDDEDEVDAEVSDRERYRDRYHVDSVED